MNQLRRIGLTDWIGYPLARNGFPWIMTLMTTEHAIRQTA